MSSSSSASRIFNPISASLVRSRSKFHLKGTMSRHGKRKNASSPHLAFDPKASAMHFHQRLANSKTQTSSLGLFLVHSGHLIEFVEDLVYFVFRYTWAGVRNRNLDRPLPIFLNRNRYFSVSGRELDRVTYEIHKHLGNLVAVRPCDDLTLVSAD